MSEAPVRLAVLGDPLSYTRSPDLHRAALGAAGIEGTSEALPTPLETLGDRLEELARLGYRGVSLTIPLKEAALAHVTRMSETARRARSINTVGFETDGVWGDTTDGPGFLDLLGTLGRRTADQRTVLLGAGGAARSIAMALLDAGCADLAVSARRPEAARDAWRDLPGAELVEWSSPDERDLLRRASLVIQATPLAAGGALPLEAIARTALLVDLRYEARATEWVRRARSLGREAYDGLGLLVFQARRSLSLWLGRAVHVDPLAAAVGWPR